MTLAPVRNPAPVQTRAPAQTRAATTNTRRNASGVP